MFSFILNAKSGFNLLANRIAAKTSRCKETRKLNMEKKRRRRPARTGMPSIYIGRSIASGPSSLNPF
jgi:hypothetical protein